LYGLLYRSRIDYFTIKGYEFDLKMTGKFFVIVINSINVVIAQLLRRRVIKANK